VNDLEEKVREIKQSIPKEDFERFKNGKLHLEKYFRDHGFDLEANVSNSFSSDKENSLRNEDMILEKPDAEFSEPTPCEV